MSRGITQRVDLAHHRARGVEHQNYVHRNAAYDEARDVLSLIIFGDDELVFHQVGGLMAIRVSHGDVEEHFISAQPNHFIARLLVRSWFAPALRERDAD